MKRTRWIPFVLACALAGCAQHPYTHSPDERIQYPAAERTDVADDYHGIRVADPYRWMETMNAPRVVSWYTAENALARRFLDASPFRNAMQARMRKLWSYTKREAPVPVDGLLFFKQFTRGREQAAIYVSGVDDALPPRLLVDPGAFSEDGRIAIDTIAPSPDGTHLAFSLSDAGSDWRTWRVVRVADGVLLDDEISWTKFTNVSWRPDGTGFYYSRHPLDANGTGDGSQAARIFFHALGAAAESDALVYTLPGQATEDLYATLSPDGRHLVVSVFSGYAKNATHVLALGKPGSHVKKLFTEGEQFSTYIGGTPEHAYFMTNLDAEYGRVMRARWDALDAEPMEEVVASTAHRLLDARLGDRQLFLHYLVDAKSMLQVLELDTMRSRTIPLPGAGSIGRMNAAPANLYFSFSSYSQPPVVLRYNSRTGNTASWFLPDFKGDLAGINVEQVFVTSRDGTRVPMFIVRNASTLDPDAPVLLYGYGGFDYSLPPEFSVPVAAWLEMGGVYAAVNLRGGGEYGSAWHLAGTRARKQNVFDDFIAAGEWLIANGVVRRDRLVARGRSNGGLLIGAVMTQRPDLFAATLPEVGVMDMLRYQHQHVEARQWESDYGISENAQDFPYLRAYSPYHNVKPGTCYPPTLVTTAIHDDRVMSWHSFKFTAALQHAQGCDNPLLLHTETRAGHGDYKPRTLLAEYFADQFAFIAKVTGWQPDVPD